MAWLFRLTTVAALAVLVALIGQMDCQTAKKAKNATRPAAQRVKKNNDRKGVSLKELTRGGDSRSKCEEIYLPMCKGLVPYTQTKLPNQFNHTTQLEVYRHLERLWPYMDQSCSKNVRLLACSTYLPKCHGKQPAQGPCKKTCMQAKKKCADMLKELMGFNWADKFEFRHVIMWALNQTLKSIQQIPTQLCPLNNSGTEFSREKDHAQCWNKSWALGAAPKDLDQGLPARNCVKPVRDTKCLVEHTHCVENSVMPMCGNLTFSWGTLPNMFGQCSVDELKTEMQQFDALVSTNCHLHLKFLICGVYSPFCVRNEVPFTFPCREICEEIRQACEPHYRRLYHQLPWPQKLQCHRYPTSESKDIQCVMPNEGSTFYGG